MLHDLRYALRSLARAPGFMLAAVLTLALGIGANTSIFSVVDAVLLRPLPYPDSSRLVMVWDQLVKLGVDRLPPYAQIFQEYSAQDRIFEATAGFNPQDRNLAGGADAERVSIMAVTASFMPMLGATPALGRGFTVGESHDDVAILSHALFTRRYGADPAIIGRSIRLDDRAYTVVGVMPPDFAFNLRAGDVDLWTPLPGDRAANMLARLKPGVSIEAAQSAMSAVAKHLDETLRPHYGPNGEDPGFRVKLVSLHDELFGDFRTATLILLCAVAAVLLIACVNVANLLLVRAVSRGKEIAVRRALGASEGRLVRLWMTEGATLALLGSISGAIAAVWGVRALTMLSPTLPRIAVDARALGFTLAASLVVSILFGLAPSLTAARLNWTLRGSTPRRPASSALVIVEVALAVMLLIGAGLLLKSFSRLRQVNAGFQPDHLLTMRIQLPPKRYPEPHRRVAFFSTLRDRLAALPGVISAGAVTNLPVNGSRIRRGGNPFSIEGQRWHPDGPVPQMAHNQIADAAYFRTLNIPVIAGRVFTDADGPTAPPVTVVNETLARGFFPRGAIGHKILLGAPQPGAKWLTIIGIVGDVKTVALDYDTMPQFYTPESQDAPGGIFMVLRTAADPAAIAGQAAEVVHTLDPDQPVYDVKTMDQRVAQSIGQPRFETVLVAFFATTALFLAAIGIFGVVAHSTEQRTQEIGIRMALGADASHVLRRVIVDGLRPVLIGIAAGVAGALALSRALSVVLFHVTPTDPAIFIFAAIALTLAAVAACLGPARKATRIDPIAALRE